ncbi:uncharacterized protein TNCV_1753631 [Trichonephila clavipes]|nr:uncharacterized protein TNCV_1753631 [Trichonephila clavipes]
MCLLTNTTIQFWISQRIRSFQSPQISLRVAEMRNRKFTLLQKLHKMSVIDTGGLPYEDTLVLNKSYIITINIDVFYGLANGAVGKLFHIDVSDDGTVTRVWLKFPESPKTSQRWRRKVSAYAEQHKTQPARSCG